MTGGGFGGCTVTLLKKEAVDKAIAFIQVWANYSEKFDKTNDILFSKPQSLWPNVRQWIHVVVCHIYVVQVFLCLIVLNVPTCQCCPSTTLLKTLRPTFSLIGISGIMHRKHFVFAGKLQRNSYILYMHAPEWSTADSFTVGMD